MKQKNINLTVLFVDVSDSTRLYESLGDAVAFREVRECLSVFQEVVVGQKGRIVKNIGDGSMCVFLDPNDAVQAACEMQQRLQQRPMLKDRQIEIQIGLVHGPVLIDGDDVHGDTVNTAARMEELAVGGQILTTEDTVILLAPDHRSATRRLAAIPIKGKHEDVAVHEVLWQASTDHTQVPGRVDTIIQQAGVSRLRLKHGGKEIIVVTSINLGRHANNGIRLKDPMASRHHAFIERRKDKFVVTDQSSNGTFVKMKTGEEFKLRRESMILQGSGALSFGHRASAKNAEIVGFWCESKDDGVNTPPPISSGDAC
ncbi:MAG TPA: adenylate/guanylate cyclase domain-containing protein [Burkholderiales bacterium]|nr:adenylate/guanylate cyclase domain-containing protein [Burkholderiales bacterium]